MSTTIFNVRTYGAVGDGNTNDHLAITNALQAAISVNGCVYFPPGRYRINASLSTMGAVANKIAMKGDGSNVSVIVAGNGNNGIDFDFQQSGIQQPYGLNLLDIGFEAIGQAGTAIRISYGNPSITNDHYRPSITMRNVVVGSGDQGYWSNGIDISSAWNISLSDIYVSGDPKGGDWNAMSGCGVRFNNMCVNAHLENVRCNFWAVGFYYNAGNGGNTEGIFFSNCSMVATQRGVWMIGNPNAPAPRMSTFTWTGGLIECRVGGVTGGSAAFHLQHVWTGLISSAQFITETLPDTHTTYGLFLDNCSGIVVTGCDINAWHIGVFTIGSCSAINIHGNTYTNVGLQTLFTPGTTGSRSYGHVLFNNDPWEIDQIGENKIGWV